MVKAGLALIAAFLALASSAFAQVTAVTEDPTVTVTMGLKVTAINEPGDSIEWWPHRREAWNRFEAARRAFPEAQSGRVYQYLNALAAAFGSLLPEPRPQYHFYVADTLNSSIWAAGDGFFVLHAGLFGQVANPRELAFLIALELAHDALGHNGALGKWDVLRVKPTPVQWWALLVAEDPIERAGFSYTLQQESDALELVYRFFDALEWAYDDLKLKSYKTIQDMARVPGLSSLQRLHVKLETAFKLPHARAPRGKLTLDPIVSHTTLEAAMGEMAVGGYQRYQWMRELARYRAKLVTKSGDPEEFREQTKDEVTDDGLLPRPARLARLYLRASLETRRHDWKAVIATADKGLVLEPRSEPFLWFKLNATASQGRFRECGDTRMARWSLFDHKRSLLIAQCAFLNGRYSTAAALLTEYRRRYPFDVEGAFWQALVDLRMRRKAEDNLGEMNRFWGERPYVRALSAINNGLKGRPSQAKLDLDSIAAVSETRAIEYSELEWGAFAFANAWFAETYSSYKERDEASLKLRAEAQKLMPVADFLRTQFPRQVWETR